jgi:hypothetical protein
MINMGPYRGRPHTSLANGSGAASSASSLSCKLPLTSQPKQVIQMTKSIQDGESPKNQLIRCKVFCSVSTNSRRSCISSRDSLNRSLTLFIHPIPNLLLPTSPTQSFHHHVLRPFPPAPFLPPAAPGRPPLLSPLGPAGSPPIVRVGRGAPSPLYSLQIQKKSTKKICDLRIEGDGRPRI